MKLSAWTRRRNVKVLFVLLLIPSASVSVACSSDHNTDATAPPTSVAVATTALVGPFTMTTATRMNEPRSVVTTGETNLPDGAKLVIRGERAATFPKADDFSSYRVGSVTAAVRGGRFEGSFNIDETEMIESVASLVGNPYSYGPLVSVSDSLLICAELETQNSGHAVQSRAVSIVIGMRGEQLQSSPQAKVIGELAPPVSYNLAAAASPLRFDSDIAKQLSSVQQTHVRVDAGLVSTC